MGEHQDLLNEYWDEFDKLTREKQLQYIWNSWNELIQAVVREWEPETLTESIKELKEMDKGWKWEAVYSNGGKPWSDRYETDKELEIGLTDFYNDFVKDDEGFCDVQVYNSKGEDFSETQFVNEIIEGIINKEEDDLMSINEALTYLNEVAGISAEENTDKWRITDDNEKDFNFSFKNDADLIKYAEELREQMGGDE